MYNREKTLEAWKTFVNSGEILSESVRPEIERSWKRCREAGLDPWSSDFDGINRILLSEKREKYHHSLEATRPAMQFLCALLGCNVSLQDSEDFVFELLTPLSVYPRTYGTFVRESAVGTGNATLVAYEKKPVRVDGFEHYRSIAQGYAGVSAPFLDKDGGYYGALNFNSPFGMLPECALDLCRLGVDLSAVLFDEAPAGRFHLGTTEFYKPLLMIYRKPTLLIDLEGHVLSANSAMRPYCPDWEDYSYGTQSLDAYLAKGFSSKQILDLPKNFEELPIVDFRKGRSKSSKPLRLFRRTLVDVPGEAPFYVCVFSGTEEPQDHKVDKRQSKNPIKEKVSTIDYIGESPQWKVVDKLVNKIAPVNANVLILGETGSGKEMVARALHRRSGRTGEFVAVNCGAIPRDLLAVELFGYEGGAFTGAKETGAIGKYEYANGGTLFLDEIGEMPVDMQVSLLRVLQEKSVTRLGSNEPHLIDARIISATNQDIAELVEEKRFRLDLYYRLSSVEIDLPSLRMRREDIALLVDYFNKELSALLDIPYKKVPQETITAMSCYTWPGNVRELRNIMERSLIMQGSGAAMTPETLPPYIGNGRCGDMLAGVTSTYSSNCMQ